MNQSHTLSLFTLMFLCACGGSETSAGVDSDTGSVVQGVRGARYCEVLVAEREGAEIRLDVYNTYGLNDCPSAQWEAIDAAQIQEEHQADFVVLNGPRHWIIDAFMNSALLDTTVGMFGGIEMRKAGQLVLPLSTAQGMATPYVDRTVVRNTTYVFEAGKMVHELVDPKGRIFVMQSFSLEQAALTEDELPKLGERLVPPEGWSFRARVLTEELRVTAVDGVATVVQDELENTYQLSQQRQ